MHSGFSGGLWFHGLDFDLGLHRLAAVVDGGGSGDYNLTPLQPINSDHKLALAKILNIMQIIDVF